MFLKHLLERNIIHGSFLIENISFSRNCDIKTTTCEHFSAKISDTFDIEYSLHNSLVAIFRYPAYVKSQLISPKYFLFTAWAGTGPQPTIHNIKHKYRWTTEKTNKQNKTN